MTALRLLDLTDELRARIDALERALARYRLGGRSAAVVELPKIALANAVMKAIAEQEQARTAKLDHPRRQLAATLRATRRRRA